MATTFLRRSAGVLLHPSSLPGRFGIGDLGPEAVRFLDWMRAAGLSVWQVLPLGPTEYEGSPYSALSTFAGNPQLISPDLLAVDGLLDGADLAGLPSQAPERVDFTAVGVFKDELLRRAFARFRERSPEHLLEELEAFESASRSWLGEWALFAALRRQYPDRGWWDWPAELAHREPSALAAARAELADEIAFATWVQFQFFRQWQRLRDEARRRGVRLLGDLPIYVSWMSAEVWSRRDLFDLDAEGRPRAVAGVPPDLFSATGQLWGNPLYLWDRLAAEGYAWWVERLRANLELVDAIRLDHFRGFAGYWRVPAGEETAVSGAWVPGPGTELFDAFRAALGETPLVAEDLGDITPDVYALRDRFGLPGMRVLQFGFEDPTSLHAPHHHTPRSVVYTGTHDNDTALGWFRGLDSEARRQLAEYGGFGAVDEGEVPWHLLRIACESVAELAVAPLQDVLGLGSEARLNTPGRMGGNWAWRLREGELTGAHAERLRRLLEITDRLPSDADEAPGAV